MAWTTVPSYTAAQILTAANLNTYLRDNLNYLVDGSGRLIPAATDHYFGPYAVGGTGVSRVRLSASSGGIAMYAEGDGANRDFHLQQKGSGSFFLETSTATLGQISSNGQSQWTGTDHYWGGYALGTGTGVSRLHVFTDAASVIFEAQGDGADRNMLYRLKGGASHFFQNAAGTTLFQIHNSGHILSGGTAPTATGSSPFTTATVTGSDTAGTISVTGGGAGTHTAGTVVTTLTFASAYPNTPRVIVACADATAAAMGTPQVAASSTQFSITGPTGAASVSTATYHYHVIY